MPHSHAVLNGPQRTHLAVLAAGIEQAVGEIEQLIAPSRGTGSRLIQYVDDLPVGFAERAAPILRQLRERLTRFAQDFQLDPRSHSRTRRVRARITSELVRIDDSGIDALRGYGEISPELGATLDPVLSELRAMLAGISGALHDHGDFEHDQENPREPKSASSDVRRHEKGEQP